MLQFNYLTALFILIITLYVTNYFPDSTKGNYLVSSHFNACVTVSTKLQVKRFNEKDPESKAKLSAGDSTKISCMHAVRKMAGTHQRIKVKDKTEHLLTVM